MWKCLSESELSIDQVINPGSNNQTTGLSIRFIESSPFRLSFSWWRYDDCGGCSFFRSLNAEVYCNELRKLMPHALKCWNVWRITWKNNIYSRENFSPFFPICLEALQFTVWTVLVRKANGWWWEKHWEKIRRTVLGGAVHTSAEFEATVK